MPQGKHLPDLGGLQGTSVPAVSSRGVVVVQTCWHQVHLPAKFQVATVSESDCLEWNIPIICKTLILVSLFPRTATALLLHDNAFYKIFTTCHDPHTKVYMYSCQHIQRTVMMALECCMFTKCWVTLSCTCLYLHTHTSALRSCMRLSTGNTSCSTPIQPVTTFHNSASQQLLVAHPTNLFVAIAHILLLTPPMLSISILSNHHPIWLVPTARKQWYCICHTCKTSFQRPPEVFRGQCATCAYLSKQVQL